MINMYINVLFNVFVHEYIACVKITTNVHFFYTWTLSSGDGVEGFGLAVGWHGDMYKCRLLCSKVAANVGGHHGAWNH